MRWEATRAMDGNASTSHLLSIVYCNVKGNCDRATLVELMSIAFQAGEFGSLLSGMCGHGVQGCCDVDWIGNHLHVW